jgi:soluble lytic murein transglycosylase
MEIKLQEADLKFPKLLIFTFISLIFSAHAQISKNKKPIINNKLYQLEKVTSAKDFNINKSDESTAGQLMELYKMLRKGYINSHALKKARRKVNKNKNFHNFKNYLKQLNYISRINSFVQGSKKCNTLEKRTISSPLENLLNKQLITLCHRYTLDAAAKTVKSKKYLPKNMMSFIEEHYLYYSRSKNYNDFHDFIDKTSTIESAHTTLSKKLSQLIIDRKYNADQELLSRIKISPELTHYIQYNGLATNDTQKIFYAELKNIINNVYDRHESDPKNSYLQEVKEVINFVNYNKSYLPYEKTNDRLLSLGRFLMRRDYNKDARIAFNFVMDRAYGETRIDSTFLGLWTFINSNDYSDANNFILQNDLLTNFAHYDSRTQFWVAYTLMRNGDNSSAINYFSKIIDDNPLSYYSIMATKNIQKIKNSKTNGDNFYVNTINKSVDGIGLSSSDLNLKTKRAFKRLRAWGKLDYRPFLKAEYKGIVTADKKDVLKNPKNFDEDYLSNNLALISSNLLGNENNYVSGFTVIYRELAKNNLEFSKTVLKQLFPMPYFSKIRGIASDKEIDPIILLSLIRQESAFNPKARSRVGARGLMQLMPSTARTIVRKVKTKSLHKPEINLNIGSQYFQYLYEKYDGNLVYTLSAYNAGESRVKRWRKEYFKSDSILHNIENIPFNETRNYVKLIFRNIFFYKLMQKELKTVDTAKPNQLFDILLGFKR